jgi:signal transduction histidine kinase
VLGLAALLAGAVAVYLPAVRVSAAIDSALQREEDGVADSLKQRLLADAEEDVHALATASNSRTLQEIAAGHGESMRQALRLNAFILLDAQGRERSFFGSLDTPSRLGRTDAARRIALQTAQGGEGVRYGCFVLAYGQAYVAAATRIRLAGDDTASVAIAFTRVEHFVLARLSQDYRLRGLDFSQEPVEGKNALALGDLRGGTIGYLVWSRSSPTETMLSALVPWIVSVVVAVALILATLGLFTLRAHRRAAAARLETEILAKSDKAKSMLFANLSHEFRTPLNAVIGFSDVMRLRMFGPLGHARYAEYVEDIHGSATHLLALIEDVLTLSRHEAEAEARLEQPVQLDAAVRDVQRMLTPAAAQKHLALLIDVTSDAVVLGSDEAIRQVVANLAGNAIKYTERGFVRISVEKTADANCVALVISDSGVGIAREHMDRILRPFEQVDDVYCRKQGGTGLGLSIVNTILARAGGKMQIDSEVGRGTRVTVHLRRAAAQAVPAREHARAA